MLTLTSVCALSSRYYTKRQGLYKLAIHFARAAAASAFIDGWKCVEMCQAYMMLVGYAVPTQRYEESRSGFYSGVAGRYSSLPFIMESFSSFSTRLALELGLNRDSKVQPLDERHERELLNRRRTWMILSIIDGGASLETGQAPGVGKDEEVCRHVTLIQIKAKRNRPLLAHIQRIPLVLSVQVPAPLRRGSPSHYRAVEYHATVHRQHEVRWI